MEMDSSSGFTWGPVTSIKYTCKRCRRYKIACKFKGSRVSTFPGAPCDRCLETRAEGCGSETLKGRHDQAKAQPVKRLYKEGKRIPPPKYQVMELRTGRGQTKGSQTSGEPPSMYHGDSSRGSFAKSNDLPISPPTTHQSPESVADLGAWDFEFSGESGTDYSEVHEQSPNARIPTTPLPNSGVSGDKKEGESRSTESDEDRSVRKRSPAKGNSGTHSRYQLSDLKISLEDLENVPAPMAKALIKSWVAKSAGSQFKSVESLEHEVTVLGNKAKEVEDLKEHVKRMEKRFDYTEAWKRSLDVLETLGRETRRLKDRVGEFEALKNEVGDLRGSVRELTAFNTAVGDFKSRASEADLEALRNEISDLRSSVRELTALKNEVRELKHRANEADALRKEVDNLKKEIAELKGSKKEGIPVGASSLAAEAIHEPFLDPYCEEDSVPSPGRADAPREKLPSIYTDAGIDHDSKPGDAMVIEPDPATSVKFSRILCDVDDEAATAENWQEMRWKKVDGDLKYHLSFHPEHLAWTVNLAKIPEELLSSIPFYIAKRPVITTHLDADWHYCEGGLDDPLHDDVPIDPREELRQDIVNLLFRTFPGATDAVVLVNGVLILSYPEPFNIDIKRADSPGTFGGLKVEFMHAENVLTGDTRITSGDGKPETDRLEIALPEDEPSRLPTGCFTRLIAHKDGRPHLRQVNLGLQLQNKFERTRYAVTMATHVLLTAMQSEELLHVKEATVASLKGINVTRNNVKIGEVSESFDRSITDGKTDGIPFIYDLTLLEACIGQDDQLPALSFQEEGIKNARLEWLREPLRVLGCQWNEEVLLLGSNKFFESGKRKRNSHKRKHIGTGEHGKTQGNATEDYTGTRRTYVEVQFAQDELEDRLDVKKGKRLVQDSEVSSRARGEAFWDAYLTLDEGFTEMQKLPRSESSSVDNNSSVSSDGDDLQPRDQASSSSSPYTSIAASQNLLQSGSPADELEILPQGIHYKCREKLSRAIIWRPDFTKKYRDHRNIVDLKFASGCPLAVRSKDVVGTPIYKVFGFQMFQKIVLTGEVEPSWVTKDEKLKAYQRGNFSCYGASVLSTELIENWDINWNRGAEAKTKNSKTAMPRCRYEAEHSERERKRIKLSDSGE